MLAILLASEWVQQENVHRLFNRVLEDKQTELMDLLEEIPQFWFSLLSEAVQKMDIKGVLIVTERAQGILTAQQAGLCLMEAIGRSFIQAAQVIIKHFPESINYRDKLGMTPLHALACQQQRELFLEVCNLSTDLEALDAQGRTPGECIGVKTPEGRAMVQAYRDCIEKKKNASLQDKTEQEKAALIKDGWTPAMVAVRYEDTKAITAASAEEINRQGGQQITPLMVAIKEGRRRAFDALLARSDLDLESADDKKKTALFYAVECNDGSLVDALLKKGAQVPITDVQGKAIFEVKCSKNIQKILRDAFLKQIPTKAVSAMPTISTMLEVMNLSENQLTSLGLELITRPDLLDSICECNKRFVACFSETMKVMGIGMCEKALGEITTFSTKNLLPTKTLKDSLAAVERTASRIFKGCTQEMARILIKRGLVINEIFFAAAIAADNCALVRFLLEQAGERLMQWYVPRPFNPGLISACCLRPAFKWYENFAQDGGMSKMHMILWALFLDRQEIVKIFLGSPLVNLNQEETHDNLPLWVYFACTYPQVPEIAKCLEARDDINPNLLIQGKSLLTRVCEDALLPAFSLLLTNKKTGQQNDVPCLAQSLLKLTVLDAPACMNACRSRPDLISLAALAQSAMQMEKNQVLELLLQDSDSSLQQQLWDLLLAQACHFGNNRSAQQIYKQKNCDVNRLVRVFEGVHITSLIAAAGTGNEMMVRLFLQKPDINVHVKGIDTRPNSPYGKTAKEVARENGYSDIADLLERFEKEGANAINHKPAELLKKAREYYERKDIGRALDLFKEVYDMTKESNERAEAAYYLGVIHCYNNSSLPEAIRLFSSQMGFKLLSEAYETTKSEFVRARALLEIGRIHYIGMGRARNLGLAYEYFTKVAAQDASFDAQAVAWCALARYHIEIDEDAQKGIHYYTLAAKQKNSVFASGEACLNLGECYFSLGELPRALTYFRLAATQNANDAARMTALERLKAMGAVSVKK